MSEIHAILGDIVSDRADTFADTITNLTTGATFTAEIESGIDPYIIQGAFGDLREAIRLNVQDATQAAALSAGNLVSFTLFGQTVKYMLLKRVDDSGSPFASFWAEKVTKQDA